MQQHKNQNKKTPWQIAIKLLATREHSQLELHRKLTSRGFAVNAIKKTLQKLIQDGWQNDERFAENYISMRINKGYGPVKITLELQNKGIATEIINQYLPQDEEYWQTQIIKVYNKKFSMNEKDYKTQVKQMRFLQHRGFTAEQIRNVFNLDTL